MFFRDFLVNVLPESPTRAKVTVNPEVGDPVSEVIELPPEFKNLFAILDVWIAKEIKEEQSTEAREAEKLRLAQKLYTTFFQGELEPAFQRLRYQDTGGVRIKIQADPYVKDTNHWFFNMPWELMIAPDDGFPLCLAQDISFVRQLPEPTSTVSQAPLLLPNPLKILVITANTRANKVKVDEETYAQPVRDSFTADPKVQVEVLKAPDLMKLKDKLAQFQPHILHFTGHGGKPVDRTDHHYDDLGYFFISKGGDSEACVIGPHELMGILKPSLSHLRLVTLASCFLGRSSQQGFAEGFAASLCAAGVPAVAAFQFEVSLVAAKQWIHSFYKRLAEGDRLDAAMTQARGAIYCLRSSGRRRDLEYGSAILFSQIADGRLFRHKQVVKIMSRADEPIDVPKIDEDVVDLTGYFKGSGLKSALLVDGVDWNGSIYPRLTQLKCALNPKMKISIEGRMHLSILAAVGFIFNETCNYKLEFKQVNRASHTTEQWCSFDEAEPLAMTNTFSEGDVQARDLIACVSISNATLNDALRLFEDKPYRGVLHCHPEAGWGSGSVPNHMAALWLARAIGAEIKRVAQDLDAARVHLFLSCPLGFALFLGMQLNGCRPVQLYEDLRPGYGPSILLR